MPVTIPTATAIRRSDAASFAGRQRANVQYTNAAARPSKDAVKMIFSSVDMMFRTPSRKRIRLC